MKVNDCINIEETRGDHRQQLHSFLNQYLQPLVKSVRNHELDVDVTDDEDYEQPASHVSDEDSLMEEEEEEEDSKDIDSSGLSSDDNDEESSESVDYSDITHVYISIIPDKKGRLLCYGFDFRSAPLGILIIKAIENSLYGGDYDCYNSQHEMLINRIINLGFYDVEDDNNRYSSEEQLEWETLSEKLFGKILINSDVGDWERLYEQDVAACGFVVTTIVKCDEV